MSAATPTASVVTSSTAAQAAYVAVTPVMGAPDNVSSMLGESIAEALEKQQISVAKGKDATAEYYLRGYVVAARDSAGAKLSYIWDLTDKTGAKRTHRLQGEQIVKAGHGVQDPWAAIDRAAIQSHSQQTAEKIAKLLLPSGVKPAVAQGASPAPQRAVASGAGMPATTASIGRASDGTAFVVPVSGAPGDGAATLTAAIRRELERKSVAIVEQPGAGSTKVEGRVSMGQPSGGKQIVQIDWIVTDPAGAQLGVVTQKNTIQQGALDGAWGATADAAASAASVKISSLLKK